MDARTMLMLCSSAIFLVLGCAHLLYTFWGPKLLPRDRQLVESMKATTLVITKQTTVWRAWIGFNASHSMAAILFGLVFGYLSLAYPRVLFGSVFLQTVGLCMLLGFLVLAWRYWFRVPVVGVSLSLVCYSASIILSHV